jgi:hypothetical protein
MSSATFGMTIFTIVSLGILVYGTIMLATAKALHDMQEALYRARQNQREVWLPELYAKHIEDEANHE